MRPQPRYYYIIASDKQNVLCNHQNRQNSLYLDYSNEAEQNL